MRMSRQNLSGRRRRRIASQLRGVLLLRRNPPGQSGPDPVLPCEPLVILVSSGISFSPSDHKGLGKLIAIVITFNGLALRDSGIPRSLRDGRLFQGNEKLCQESDPSFSKASVSVCCMRRGARVTSVPSSFHMISHILQFVFLRHWCIWSDGQTRCIVPYEGREGKL